MTLGKARTSLEVVYSLKHMKDSMIYMIIGLCFTNTPSQTARFLIRFRLWYHMWGQKNSSFVLQSTIRKFPCWFFFFFFNVSLVHKVRKQRIYWARACLSKLNLDVSITQLWAGPTFKYTSSHRISKVFDFVQNRYWVWVL